MKKRSLVSVLLAALLVFSLGLNALAAGSDNNASEPSDTVVDENNETDNRQDSAPAPAPTEEEREEEQIAEEIRTLEENGTVTVSGTRSLRTDELRQIAEKNGGLNVSVSNASWHFNSITNPDVEFNPRMTVGGEHPEITQKMGNTEGVVVSFEHSGVLPGTAYVGITVDYAVGTPLYFYYYNPATAGFEYQGSTVVENGGYAIVTLTHCSDYVLTTTPLHDVAQAQTTGATAPAGSAASAASQSTAGTLDVTPHTGL